MLKNETDILKKIKVGDLDVFHYLYTEYYAPLCICAKSYTRSSEIAEEIVQEVFLRLWEQRDKLNITESIRAYLYISVRNHSINHLKHIKVVKKFNGQFSGMIADAEFYNSISLETGESMVIADELNDCVDNAINSLPAQCRKIFVLSRKYGLKHQDIANILNITIHCVHKQISIALEKLKDALLKHK